MEFKKYLRGVGDAGTRLLFKFRSGTHGLNEELGRHRGREGRKECLLCDVECESVSHVLWDCPAYASIRSAFMLELRLLPKTLCLVYIWEERKVRLYGEHANVHQSHSQNDSGDLRGVAGGDGELGCLSGKAGTIDGSAHCHECI